MLTLVFSLETEGLRDFTDCRDLKAVICVHMTTRASQHIPAHQDMKKLMSLRQSLHVMMQCFMRQHFADRYWPHGHPGGHASWREPTMRKLKKKKIQSLTSWKDLYADEMFRRRDQNRVNMFGRQQVSSQTVGESKKPWRAILKSMHRKFGRETGWTLRCRLRCWTRILQSWLRRFWRHFVNNSKRMITWMQLRKLQAQYQKSLLSVIKNLERRRKKRDDVNGGYLPEDLMLAARREEIDWVHSEGVYAGMKPLDLIWVDTNKSVDPTRKKIRSRLCAREYKTKKQGKIQGVSAASQLFSTMPPLEAVKVLVTIMMSVSLSSKGKPLKLRHHDISRAHFQGTAQRLFTSDFLQRIVRSMAKTKLADWRRACTERKTLPTSGNLIMWTWSVESWEASEEANTVQHCSTIRIKMWEWQCTATTLCVCQMTMESNTSTVFSNPNTQRKTWEHLDSQIQTWKAFCCWTVCLDLGLSKLDSTWTFNLTRDTHHSMNQEAIRTLKQWAHEERNYKTNWC